MTLVNKPALIPSYLDRGVAVTAANCAAFDINSRVFVDGEKNFDFDKRIYGHPSVKSVLETAQHSKCCYCENRFRAAAPGDVEHFRPKKALRQDKGLPLEYPGYFWLAYSWSNLYFSCPNCNRSGKKRFFPISDPTKRARSHNDNIDDEEPLLLDPGGPDDPRDHIHFHGEVAVGITVRGRQTVKTLMLDRQALNEERLVDANHLRMLEKIVKIFAVNPLPQGAGISEDARRYLENAVKPDAKFSAMAQDLLR